MQGRLQARGLAIGLSILLVLVVSPTPVPRLAVQAWESAARAAASGDNAGASEALQTLQAAFPWLDELRRAEIPLALARDDGPAALAMLDDAPALQAEAVAARCWKSEALVLVGRWQDAIPDLPASVGDTCPQVLRRLSAAAEGALVQRDLSAAIGLLEALTRLDPDSVGALARLGAARTLTDPASALPLLERAAAGGEPLAADLLAALRTVPPDDLPTTLARGGGVLLAHGDWPLAALAFGRLIELDPANGQAHAYFGLALKQLGQDGLVVLEQAARLAPESPATQSALGLYWLDQGQPLKALPFLERALELDPASGPFTASLAAAEAEAGDIQRALTHYRQAAQIDPAAPAYWALLADFCLSREIEIAETGVPAARNALVLQPESAESLDLLGQGHLRLGNHVLAERLLSKAVGLAPTSARPRLHYGMLLLAVDRVSEAVAHLSAAAELGGDTPVGRLARRALAQIEG